MRIVKRNNKILVFTFFILLLNGACENKTEYNVLSGQLLGYVSLSDSNYIQNQDKSGIEVIVEGSNPQIKAVTDEEGNFMIDNLKCGTYNLIFNKEGYCQHKIVGYQFVGGSKPTSLNQVRLYWKPNMLIDSLKIANYSDFFSNVLQASAKVSNLPEHSSFYYRYYLSNKSDISYKDYASTDIVYGSSYDKTPSFYLQIDTIKFPVGSKFYMIMYPASEKYQYYTDINTGNKIYTSININKHSDTISSIVPQINGW